MSHLLVAGLAHRDRSVGVVAWKRNVSCDTSLAEHFTAFPTVELFGEMVKGHCTTTRVDITERPPVDRHRLQLQV